MYVDDPSVKPKFSMIIMETGPSVCANGVNIQNVNKKELLIQRY